MSDAAKIKPLLEDVSKLFDSIEEGIGRPDGLDIPLRDVFKVDILSMILYFNFIC